MKVKRLLKIKQGNIFSSAQFDFYQHLIITKQLKEAAIIEEITALAQRHAQFAKYGLKPHFLDLWQQNFQVTHSYILSNASLSLQLLFLIVKSCCSQALIEKIQIEEKREQDDFHRAWKKLNSFIIDWMNYIYAIEMGNERRKSRRDINESFPSKFSINSKNT